MVGAELGHQVGGVLGGVDAKGVGNHQQRLGERADGELLAGTLRGGRESYKGKIIISNDRYIP